MSAREIHVGNTLDRDLVLEGDVAIVGTGAGGAISAEILARAGLRVVIVEEGAYRTPRGVHAARGARLLAPVQRRRRPAHARTARIAIVQGRTVGGSTTVNWTSSFRTPEPTLRYWRDSHGIEGLAPEATSRRGSRRWSSACTSRRGRRHNLNNELLARGAATLGWRHGVIRRNVLGCANLGYCGLGCPIGAKQSMDVTAIPDALDHGAVLVTRVRAERLALSGDRVTAVEGLALDERGVRPTGRRVSLRAPWVIVAAAAINSPALLLRSKVPDPHRRIGKRTFLQTHNYSLAFMPEVVDPFSRRAAVDLHGSASPGATASPAAPASTWRRRARSPSSA